MKHRYITNISLLFALLAGVFTGCSTGKQTVKDEIPAVVIRKTNAKIPLDGTLSAKVWENAPEYKLIPYTTHENMQPKTAAAVSATKYWTDVWVKILYDDENLYIGFRIENDDIHAMLQQDQKMLFLYGDTMEVFLKPVQSNSYFEFYANASGNKSTFFYPSRSFRGTNIASLTELLPGINVYSHVNGTLNNSSDTDQGWTSVMVISRKTLEQKTGIPFHENTPWTILFAGYAYSQNKIHGSLFSYPKLPQLNYHLTEYYAPLVLEKHSDSNNPEHSVTPCN